MGRFNVGSQSTRTAPPCLWRTGGEQVTRTKGKAVFGLLMASSAVLALLVVSSIATMFRCLGVTHCDQSAGARISRELLRTLRHR
jgi:hypothetical protein